MSAYLAPMRQTQNDATVVVKPTVVLLDDDELLREQPTHNGAKFCKLYYGARVGDYPSDSEAD